MRYKRFIIAILTVLAVISVSGCKTQESSDGGQETDDTGQDDIALVEVSEKGKDIAEAFFPVDTMYSLYEYNAPEDASVLSVKHLLYKDGRLEDEDTLINIDLKEEKEFLKGTISVFQTQQDTYNVVCNTGKQSTTVNSVEFERGGDQMVSVHGSVLQQEGITLGEKYVLYVQYSYPEGEGEEISLADASSQRELEGEYDMDIVELSFS